MPAIPPHSRRPFLCLLITALMLAALPALAADQYQVRFDEGLGSVGVRLCFDGQAPSYLRSHRDASDFLSGLRRLDENGAPAANLPRRFSWRGLRLDGLPANSCIAWRVNISDAVERNDWRTALATRSGDAVLLPLKLWYWPASDREAEVRVMLPEGDDISVPWLELPDDGPWRRFRPQASPVSWTGRSAIGRIGVDRPEVGGTELRVATVGSFTEQQRQDAVAWVREAAQSVAGVAGQFPRKQPQILVVGIGRQNEPVPWAQVTRGGGVAAHFYVDQHRPLAEFQADWTPTHELSHMLLPYVSGRDRWLSEGLASYYQNVLRARDGRLSERQAWARLEAGFGRGRRDTGSQSLAQASREMRSQGNYMRVYWSGAAILLMADVELRRQSGGKQTLDSVLAEIADCCMDNGKSWRARELFERMDRISGTEVFSELYARYANSASFPDVENIYPELGIERRGRRLTLDDDAAEAEIRSSIMR